MTWNQDIGWNEFFEEQRGRLDESSINVARVINGQKSQYKALAESGEIYLKVLGRMLQNPDLPGSLPVVGDWVVYDPVPGEDKGVISSILQRFNSISRKAIGKRSGRQIIAANIDIMFIVSSFDSDFSINRLERYVTIAKSNHTKPIIILNKVDLVNDAENYISKVKQSLSDITILTMSALKQIGVESIMENIGKRKTSMMVGSSGVGKSTLINELLGEDRQKVEEVREGDDKGRHTTSTRDLFILPNGGMIIDNPGMREVQLWLDENELLLSFTDIEELSMGCRYANCQHIEEPSCAVKEAIKEGTLSQRRLESYHKQKKELKFLTNRSDIAAQRVEERNLYKTYKQAQSRKKPKR